MRFVHALERVRRRMRLQAALDGGARAAVLAAAALLVGVYLWRLGVLAPRGLALVAAGALALTLAGALARALRRIPLERAALLADVAHGLQDRLRSALTFAADPAATEFMRAAIADADARGAAVEPRRAAPLRRPEALAPAAVVVAVAGVVALLHFPAHAPTVASAPRPPRLVVADGALEPEQRAAAELAAEARRAGDKDLEQLADELNQVLSQIDAEELTRKQAFDKLAELDKKYLGLPDGTLEQLERKLKKAGDELSKSKLLSETGKALSVADLEKAKKELEKLAAEAEQQLAQPRPDAKFDQQQREQAAKALEQAAKDEAARKQEAQEKQREQQLRDEERRLRQQLAQRPQDEELQRKLQRNQRELEKLERDKQERAEQQRQLQRLQRELEKAAEQLRQKLSPQALKQLAQSMKQMESEIRKLGNLQRAQVQIAEIKEVLRRAGRSQQGDAQAQNGQKGQNGQNGQSGQKGQKGKGGKSELLRDFDQRAGGDQKSNVLLLGEQGGQGGNVLLPLPLGGQGDQKGPRGDGDDPSGGNGDGIGSQHDPNLMGAATKLAGQRHDTRVEGKEGAGPSRSQTILGSAEKGFASTGYKRVYGDYTAVVEEVMSKERVPPGYRFYVKRYFQLIKPRE